MPPLDQARLRVTNRLRPPGWALFIIEPRSGYSFALPSPDRTALAASRGPA